MDINAAAYRLVHDYPGGAHALAARVGKRGQVLINEVNPHNTSHKFGLADAVDYSEVADNPVVLFAFAERMGFVCMPSKFAGPQDRSPILALSGLISAHGDVGEAVSQALEDGRIDGAELADIEEAVLGNIEHLHSVLRAVRAAHRKGVRNEAG
ncbi:hypothetical protein NK214_06510 [Chromobacterium sp. S0633]|uniref:phage regulatory CII family protein n=1 Tax=Chromobacterium sp. S0633 TaxID=2957805 RepID=UPI00209FF9FE|nr:phage regulatory CII family protein [Chromobacterium sp. S0633]MCP1289841.1 hypothetical protein [Chromobacterium sp. S0633]